MSSQTKVEFSITVNHQEQRTADFVWLAQMALKGQFWTPSCYFFCNNGVSYYLDPTTLITNQGLGVEQCLVFGGAGGGTYTDTCTGGNFPYVIGLSVSTATPAAGDTYAGGSGVACSSANVIVDGHGLDDVAGAVTAAANSASVDTTIANTFTAGASYSAVQVACLLTSTVGGVNPLIYAEGQFGPDSLVSGNTLTITWSITRT